MVCPLDPTYKIDRDKRLAPPLILLPNDVTLGTWLSSQQNGGIYCASSVMIGVVYKPSPEFCYIITALRNFRYRDHSVLSFLKNNIIHYTTRLSSAS
jgi:hypothetical protein